MNNKSYKSLTPMENLAILFNPSAGRGKALKKKEALEHFLQRHEIDYDLFITQSEEDLREQAKEISEKYRIIVGAGGDSTFNIIINELIKKEADVEFGMIGLGSSNDITKEFEIDSLEKACAALKRRKTKRIDLGCIISDNKKVRYFLGQANIGLGVLVNKYVEDLAYKKSKASKIQTVSGALGIMDSYKSKKIPLPLTIESEEGSIEGDFILAVFSNIKYWATGRKANPSAQPDDGKLDCCLIKDSSLRRFVHLLLLSSRGKHTKKEEVDTLQSQYFEVSSEKVIEIQTDGEIIGGFKTPTQFKKIRFEVIPQALNIIC